ncbi:hypothetical protein QOT17_013399 [Balamuthia mandrillaris]
MKKTVLRKVKNTTLVAITKFVQEHKPKLWGLKKKGQFIENSVMVALYKDLTAQGYNTLSQEQGPKEAHGQVGLKTAWETAGANVERPKWLQEVNLTMDSTDAGKQGRRSTSKKDDAWSFKENRPGRRYMTILDLQNRVCGLWGGYSPKTYDAHWVLAQQEHFDRKWKGVCIAADCHFALPRDTFENLRIMVPVAEKKGTTLSDTTKRKNAELC